MIFPSRDACRTTPFLSRFPTTTRRDGAGHHSPAFCCSFRHRNSGLPPLLHVPPFIGWSVRLLWLLLTSDHPSRNLSIPVAQGRSVRPPRVMRVTFTLIPAAFTSTPSVQVSGFEDNGLLTRCVRLVCDFCSSGQCFACGFLQIPPRNGHPCRPANRSPCRVGRGLAPPSHRLATTTSRIAPVTALRAMPGAPPKKRDGQAATPL